MKLDCDQASLTVRRRFSLFALHLLAMLLVAVLTTLLTVSSHLLLQSGQRQQTIKKNFDGYYRYTLHDSLYEPDEFYQFRKDRERLNTVVTFYNGLHQSSDITLLSIFHQPLYLSAFDKGDNFLYGDQSVTIPDSTELPLAVKSVQLNQKAFEFYKLTIKDGETLDWGSLSFSVTQPYPLILGSNYRGHYQVGDLLVADLYMKDISFQVVGFLPPNSSIYYQLTPEFYLDDYMIVPYPSLLSKVGAEDFSFEGMLYFSMLNSQFVTRLPMEKILDIVQHQSYESGFTDFSIKEIGNFRLKYEQLIALVGHYRWLIVMLLVVLILIFAYLITSLILLILHCQRDLIGVSYLLGYPLKSKIVFKVCSLLCFTSVIICAFIELTRFDQLRLVPFVFLGNLLLYGKLYVLLRKH